MVQFFGCVGHIDHVERIVQVVSHTAVNTERIANHTLLVHIGAQGGNHINGAIYFVSMLPNDGIGVAQLGVLRVLTTHQPHLLISIGTNTLRALIHAVVGDDFQREILVAARLDVQELIRQGFLLREVDGHSIHHVVVLYVVCRTVERHDFNARLDDARVGIAIDRVYLSLVQAKLLDDGVQREDDVLRLLLGGCRRVGTNGCKGAASDEQHDKYSFHNCYFFYFDDACSILYFEISSSSSAHFR